MEKRIRKQLNSFSNLLCNILLEDYVNIYFSILYLIILLIGAIINNSTNVHVCDFWQKIVCIDVEYMLRRKLSDQRLCVCLVWVYIDSFPKCQLFFSL